MTLTSHLVLPTLSNRRDRDAVCGRTFRPRRSKKPARFRPLPSAVVFPTLPAVGFSLLASGLVFSATAILAGDEAATHKVIASLVLAAALAFLLAVFAILVRLRRLVRPLWERATTPTSAAEIGDPVYRAASVALRACRRRMKHREQGHFKKEESEIAEPRRTERLLGSPLTCFRTVRARTPTIASPEAVTPQHSANVCRALPL